MCPPPIPPPFEVACRLPGWWTFSFLLALHCFLVYLRYTLKLPATIGLDWIGQLDYHSLRRGIKNGYCETPNVKPLWPIALRLLMALFSLDVSATGALRILERSSTFPYRSIPNLATAISFLFEFSKETGVRGRAFMEHRTDRPFAEVYLLLSVFPVFV